MIVNRMIMLITLMIKITYIFIQNIQDILMVAVY